jgi:hypothetical protein
VGGKYAERGEIDGSTPSQDLTRKGSRALKDLFSILFVMGKKKGYSYFPGEGFI